MKVEKLPQLKGLDNPYKIGEPSKELAIDVDIRVYVKIHAHTSRSMPISILPSTPMFRVKKHIGLSRLSIVLHGSWIFV